MSSVLEMPMARTKRAKENSEDKPTTHVRIFTDVAEMVSWIVRVEKGSSALLLDPMIRKQIEARYLKHEPIIEKLKAAESELRKIEEEAEASMTQPQVRKQSRRAE